MTSQDLPLRRVRAERSDAVRNRAHLLDVARRMIAEDGPDSVTMDELARRAGLGKGTVFRRFGSRAGIFDALLDDAERRFQDAALSGPPPLGPGADPRVRLVEFGRRRIDFLLENCGMVRAADESRRDRSGAQAQFTPTHLAILLRQVAGDRAPVRALSVQLAYALEAPIVVAGLDSRAAPELKSGWESMVGALDLG